MTNRANVLGQPRFDVIYSRLHTVCPIATFGPAIEEMGFGGIWVTEGLVNEEASLDIVVALQAFASHTQKIRIGTCVMLLPLRHPVMVAKQIASVDHLSGGRVDFGIGVGGARNSNRAAFDACGIPLESRGRRTDECLEIVHRLWSGGEVSFEGEFHRFDKISMEPRPDQRPRPPIWAGGGASEPVLRRTARWCDGWVPAELTPDEYSTAWERLSGHCEQWGRAPEDITKGVHLYLSLDRNHADALALAEAYLSKRYGFPVELDPNDSGRYAFGTPADCIETIKRFRAAGVTNFVLNVARPSHDVLPQLQRFQREVMPFFR